MHDQNWAIGVDLGGTKMEIGHVDMLGNVHQRVRYTHANRHPDYIMAQIEETAKQLIADAVSPALGLGIGVPGQIERATGRVSFAPNLQWRDVPIKKKLEQALNIPVHVTNDVRAAAMGEWVYGAGAGCEDLVCLFIGTGIGGGVVSGGHMLLGHSNSAGELGHTTIDWMGKTACSCGNSGCLEAFASGWAIAKRAREAVQQDPAAGAQLLKSAEGQLASITAEKVVKAFFEGDRLAETIINAALEALVAGCVSLVNTFNPRMLLLGGGVSKGLSPILVSHIEAGIKKKGLSQSAAAVEVVLSKLSGNAGLVGSAALALL